jgi:glutamate-1-semialdehyde 2,1-aminomutase
MRRNPVVEHLWRYGERLIALMAQKASAHGIAHSFKAGGVACSPYYLTLDAAGAVSLPLRTLFCQEMIRNGVLMPWIALSFRHGDAELAQTAHALDRSFAVYRRALDEGVEKYLVGPAIKPVFRKHN